MIVTDRIDEIRRQRHAVPGLTWGLVPTMGYLHNGHLALVAAARAANERVAVSIYVNPTQFAPTEDLASYPRDLQRDLALLKAAGVDLVFTPSDAVMYPDGFQTYVAVEEVTRTLEGAARPTHFRGVATVVAKLFNIFQPTRAYFGQKDAQQTIVLQRMVADLAFPLELIVCPTVREADGLAMSSRNRYLTPDQRAAAPVLHRALTVGAEAVRSGSFSGEEVRLLMTAVVDAEPLARLDYVSAADPRTLREIDGPIGRVTPVLLSGAVFFGQTRLIDNELVSA